MNAPQSRPFELVVDQVEPTAAPPAPQAPPPQQKTSPLNGVAIAMMQMALIALGQRALVALAACFTLLTVGSAFWLWYLTPEPTDRQIVSLTIYAVFVLAINMIVRRK
jgi:hypothetical protein